MLKWTFTFVTVVCTALSAANGAGMTAPPDPAVNLNRQFAQQAFSDRANADLPFSFTYNGRPSSAFIQTWKRQLKSEQPDQARLQHTLTLTDPDTALEIKAVATVYTDTPGVDWTLYFTNRGAKDTPILEQIKALDVPIAIAKPNAAVVLHRLNGSLCAADDWIPFDQPLQLGQRIDMATTDGRSSNTSPFFNLSWGDGGVITAVGWSGQWTAGVERAKDGKLAVQAGMSKMRVTLRPGETIRTPRILQLYWSGNDPLESYNLFRKTMFAHIMVRLDGQLVLPPIAHMSTSFYELNNSTEQNVLSHLESIKGLGFDTFWLDAPTPRWPSPVSTASLSITARWSTAIPRRVCVIFLKVDHSFRL